MLQRPQLQLASQLYPQAEHGEDKELDENGSTRDDDDDDDDEDRGDANADEIAITPRHKPRSEREPRPCQRMVSGEFFATVQEPDQGIKTTLGMLRVEVCCRGRTVRRDRAWHLALLAELSHFWVLATCAAPDSVHTI